MRMVSSFENGNPQNAYKASVAKQFGQAAAVYEAQARLQNQAGDRLLNLLDMATTMLPDGDVLEIGCGTGFITRRLIHRFPDRRLHITDLSADMLKFCQSHLDIPVSQTSLISFDQIDGEALNVPDASYALIVTGFVIQWFERPLESLTAMLAKLKPGGILLLSFPTCESFPEWKTMCEQINVPCTANGLPDPNLIEHLTPINSCHVIKEAVVANYPTVYDFFNSLKAIGAGGSQTQAHLSVSQLRRLIRYWQSQFPDNIQVHYHVVFAALQKLGIPLHSIQVDPF
jgi:malonyl-CoA O-methyltransferase